MICPSLQQRSQHDTRQADGHAQEPERVDQYDRAFRSKLVGIDEGRRRQVVARYILVVHEEQFVSFHEIERPFVERV